MFTGFRLTAQYDMDMRPWASRWPGTQAVSVIVNNTWVQSSKIQKSQNFCFARYNAKHMQVCAMRQSTEYITLNALVLTYKAYTTGLLES
jgi:hypothetical protein